MNLLKSIFISSFMMFCVASTGIAAWMLWQGRNFYGWAGVLLASFPFLATIG